MDAFLGMIAPFAFNFAPNGWQQCNGQLLSISANSALFALLGTQFGGNGTTTFQLPDLRGRVPVGYGQGPGLSNWVMGEVDGAEQVSLLPANLPQHSHTVPASTGAANRTSPSGNNLAPASASDGSPVAGYTNAAVNTTLGTQTGTGTGTASPVNLTPPSLGISYCICISGIFPSRN